MAIIAAIATPAGLGAIGIIRISGTGCKDILKKVFVSRKKNFSDFVPWLMHHGTFFDLSGKPIDDVLTVYMPGPNTYSGEDMAEIHCHGGQIVVRSALETVINFGCRLAEKGEFTYRAFMNGRLDLPQAEAVAELVSAHSKAALNLGIARYNGILTEKVSSLREMADKLRMQICLTVDFSEDEISSLDQMDFLLSVQKIRNDCELLLEGKQRAGYLQNGAHVVLVGSVNAGKSSIYNAILRQKRAIVSPTPGTTRDYLETLCYLNGYPVYLTDTAGLRSDIEVSDCDQIEKIGIEQSLEIVANADCIVLVYDGSALAEKDFDCCDHIYRDILEKFPEKKKILVWNKSDKSMPKEFPQMTTNYTWCVTSAKNGNNIDVLTKQITDLLFEDSDNQASDQAVPNLRQALLLEEAVEELKCLENDILAGTAVDCCSTRLEVATSKFAEITGKACTAEILNSIFSNFCIGK